MDKVTLTSLRSLPNCDNYAIGVFQDKELYLTPVKSIVQMRPQFNYLEKNDKRTKDDGRNNDDGKFTIIKSSEILLKTGVFFL